MICQSENSTERGVEELTFDFITHLANRIVPLLAFFECQLLYPPICHLELGIVRLVLSIYKCTLEGFNDLHAESFIHAEQ